MMRTSPLRNTLLVVTVALLPVLAAPASGQAVLAAHDARIAATIKGDVAALGALMTDDLTYTHSSGVTETKAEFLDGLKSGKYLYREIKPGSEGCASTATLRSSRDRATS